MAKSKRLPAPRPPLPFRIASLHAKLVLATAIGIFVALLTLLLPYEFRLTARLLLGWNVGVAIYLYLTLAMMLPPDIERIRKRAAAQDEGAFVILVLSVGATLASLVAIVILLGGSKQAPHGPAVLQVLLAITTILLSWSFMHTIFALHHAHEYYGGRRDGITGGLNFPGDKQPAYWDFLYFSLVIGMTSQVSDVAITNKLIRRVAVAHSVLSFFFNVTVLALTINIVSNLI
jgi:uncharacterized membrane protein